MNNYRDMLKALLDGEYLLGSLEIKVIYIDDFGIVRYTNGHDIDIYQLDPKWWSIKPKTRTLNGNGIEYPEPLLYNQLTYDEIYHIPHLLFPDSSYSYRGSDIRQEDCDKGLVQATKDGAIAQAHAILAGLK